MDRPSTAPATAIVHAAGTSASPATPGYDDGGGGVATRHRSLRLRNEEQQQRQGWRLQHVENSSSISYSRRIRLNGRGALGFGSIFSNSNSNAIDGSIVVSVLVMVAFSAIIWAVILIYKKR